jgi:nucleoside-diphosphate-sugar epimerase
VGIGRSAMEDVVIEQMAANTMNVLVTGADGYLGCLVAGALMRDGHHVTAIDTGYYRSGWLYHGLDVAPRMVSKDVRAITAADVGGMDAIVHMAELSNDPLGALSPTVTFDINHAASVRLASLARDAGVERFVYMSSCSVYGVAHQAVVDEISAVNPQTTYAECKVMVERDVGAMAAPGFAPTFLRNATAYGASPRQRFDLVLNNLMGLAWTTGEITMISDGTPWRPLVHALDIAKAISCVLAAPPDVVRGETFNVGSNEQNYQVREIAEIVAEHVPGCVPRFGDSADNRSYRVNFDKIHGALTDFACAWDAPRGAKQLADVFARVGLDAALFNQRSFTRLRQLEHLIATKQLDTDLFWADAV